MINTKQKSAIYQLLLIVIIYSIYSISANYPIFKGWDDQYYILKNSRLTLNMGNIIWYFKNSYFGNYIPLTMISFMIDHYICGINPLCYHLQNIFWHVLATLALFHIFRKFNISALISFLVCLLFSCHPQRIESVVWISERKDVLCAAFYFWSIYFYIKNKEKISFILFICAILSKSMAISLPIILCLYEYHRNKSFSPTHYLKKLLPFLIIMLIFIPITFIAQGKAVNGNIPLPDKLLIVIHNIIWYIQKTFIPDNLNPIYPPFYYFNNIYVFICYCLAIFTLLTAIFLKNKENFLLIFLSYLIALAPVSGIVKLGFIDRADRYSYIPSAFIWFGAALLIMQSIKSHSATFKKLITIFMTTIILFYGLKNYEYQQFWKTFDLVLDKACSYKNSNIIALKIKAEHALSIKDYKEAYFISDIFLNLNKQDPKNRHSIYCYISAIYIRMKIAYEYNQIPLALKYFNLIKDRIIKADIWYENYLLVGAGCYNMIGNKTEAIRLMDKVLKLDNLQEFDKFFYGGIREYYANDYKKAVLNFNNALKIRPDDNNLLLNIKKCKKFLQKTKK
jgi:protein O-mannosyl-transferase